MKRIKSYYRHCFKTTILIILILVQLPFLAQAEPIIVVENKISTEQRNDGLTIVISDQGSKRQEIQYFTLILKTGFAHDPVGKSGLTNLTNEIIKYLFSHTNALYVDYQSYADYSAFHFAVALSDFNQFCNQLDQIIRLDALLYYDLCNELIRYHLNQPKKPGLKAFSQLYSLVYGPNHPYTSIFYPNYEQLDINEVNKWFRQIYKPNNLIIASSAKLPQEFLRRPAGRDLTEAVSLKDISPPAVNTDLELKWTPIHDNMSTVYLGFETAKFGEEGILATNLLQKYLGQRLWKVIREDNGLSYDPEVYYQLTGSSSAPMLLVAFHSLTENTGAAINLVLGEFKKIAAEGISEAEVQKIMARERKQRELMGKDLRSTIKTAALYGLTGQKWLIDHEDYFTRLTNETKMVPQVMTAGLARLKISVAGPEATGQYLKDVTLETK